MASLDLSSAFDVVNTALLITRLRIIGLPEDVIKLIELWLKERTFYSTVHSLKLLGYISMLTVQRSITGLMYKL